MFFFVDTETITVAVYHVFVSASTIFLFLRDLAIQYPGNTERCYQEVKWFFGKKQMAQRSFPLTIC